MNHSKKIAPPHTNFNTHFKKVVEFLGISLMLSSLLLAACKSKPKEETVAARFVLSDTMMNKIEMTEVTLQQVEGELRLGAKVTADEDKLVDIYPLVGGNVSSVNAELGQFVNKGEVLAVIKSGEIADYERQLIDAQSDMSLAEKNFSIAQGLYEGKLASEKELLSAKKELEKAKAELDRIQEVFKIYGITTKAEYVIKSPISGFVIERNISRDMQLRSDKADNVFTIAQITDVYISANVYENDISKIHEGQSALVSVIAYPHRVFEGKIDRLFNVLDPTTKAMKARVKLHNLDLALKPEMNGTVVIHYLLDAKKRPTIPSSAVIFDKSRYFVMVYKERNNIETRSVEIFKQTNGTTYITSGLAEGEKVISKNPLFIYDALND
jgi:membrane fusion protein, heavy metal efflux system